jgi:hypothetical protein
LLKEAGTSSANIRLQTLENVRAAMSRSQGYGRKILPQ